MKKHITLLSCLCLASGFYAQQLNKSVQPKIATITTEKHVGKTPAEPKALGTVVWSDNFSTATNWTIDNSGQTGAGFGWDLNSSVDGWYFGSPINSTSDGNFAELSNGDPSVSPATQALNVVYTLTTANPIDLTMSGTDLVLSFLQYGALFNDSQEFQISTDGTTFTTIGSNNEEEVLSQSGGAAYANPYLKTINLANQLAGETQLWIRFSWTTRFPAQAANANVWITYGWMIDDVTLTTMPDYDLKITDNYWGTAGLGYYQIPDEQIAPIDYSVNVINEGSQDLTDVQLGVNINAGVFTGTSNMADIASLDTDSLGLTTQFTPAGVGSYSVVRTLTMTEADDVPTNNALSTITFTVGDNIYARDNNTPNGYTTSTTGFETGNFYDIWADQVVKGVNVRIASGTPANIEVYARIYKIENGDLVWQIESDLIPVPSSSFSNSNYTIYLGDEYLMEANNTYLVVVGSYDANLRIANAGTSVDQTSFFLDGNDMETDDLFYQNDTPMVRLNFDPTLSADEIAEVATNVVAAPNPFNNETSVSFNLKNSAEVALVVTDMAGRTVYTVDATTMNAGAQAIAIDAAAFNAGIYSYTLTIDGKSITNRIVKK